MGAYCIDLDQVDETPKNGISLELISHEKVYNRLTYKPIIVNDYAATLSTGAAAEKINELIRTHYQNDQLDTLPTCDCGLITGSANEGVLCDVCHTEVRRIVDRPLQSQIWMRTPDIVPAFISPRFWSLFTTYTGGNNTNGTSKRFCLLEYLTDPMYIPGGKGSNLAETNPAIRNAIKFLKDHQIERGLDKFYYDFDRIMAIILDPANFGKFKVSKDADRARPLCDELRELVTKYRDCIFTRYLPFPSRIIMVSEQTGNNAYIDPNSVPAFNAVKMLCSIENDPMRLSNRAIVSRTVRVIKLLAEYYNTFKQKTCGRKQGIFRRQMGSTRSPYTGRAVVTPQSGTHEYDEVHTPWGWTVALMSVQLSNKLLNRDYNPRNITKLLDKHTNNSEGAGGDLINELFNELIAECPEGGIPLQMLRNPTLERLSSQCFRITKVIRNTDVYAIKISVLAIRGSNCDFDGDMLQCKLLLDNKEKALFSRLRPHLGLIDTDNARRIKGVHTLHPETITMINNFLYHNRMGQ